MKKFVSSREIVFDDCTHDEEYGTYWVGMCSACFNKYKNILAGKEDDCGSGVCSVYGCNNEADYYIDFTSEELQSA